MENVTSQLFLNGYMITSNNLSPHSSCKRRSVHKLYTTDIGKESIGLHCYSVYAIHILTQLISVLGKWRNYIT